MITRLKNLLAMMLLISSIALMNAPVWAQDDPQSDGAGAVEVTQVSSDGEGVPLSEEQLTALATEADENRSDLPNITYTPLGFGFKVKMNRIRLKNVVDYTLNGEPVTAIINNLIDQQIMSVTERDNGFEIDVLMEPTLTLPSGAEFGVILDNGLKLSSVIYQDDDKSKSISFAIGGLFAGLFDSLNNALNWNNQPKDRLLVKGYVKQADCDWWWGCYHSIPYQWVNIYTYEGHNWTYKNTVQTDQFGFYSLMIEDYCGLVAAYTSSGTKQAWRHENVWGSCSPSVNEQFITLMLR